MSAVADLTRTTATQGLDEAMTARAHNLRQAELIFNQSPETDSLAELAAALARHGAPDDLLTQMFDLCREVLDVNEAEAGCELRLTGLLEAHVTRSRTAPLAERLTAKGIARRLRGPLGVLLDPASHDGIAFFKASAAVRDVIAACPREQLLASAVRHELRGRKFGLLAQLSESAA
jgi:hypothetical protein